MTSVAAIDLGATSGRVVAGTLQGNALHLTHVARFRNTPVRLNDGLHWDALALFDAAMRGLGQASRADPDLRGAAVDSWAVDYGLLRHGRLMGNPYHYRDARNAAGVEAVHAVVDPVELYRRNGLQHLPFNTLFQLAAAAQDGELDEAERVLLIPDLLHFWATGVQVAELTNATTTGLVAVGDADWDWGLLPRLGLRRDLLPTVVPAGTTLGPATATMRHEYGVSDELIFSTVGSHDTASAVVGVPLISSTTAYISCGTWSLVGTELEQPLISDAARTAGFTNEGGVDGRTRFLKNVMGLWLLSESIRAWEQNGPVEPLETLLEQAAQVPDPTPFFNANDPRLLAPGDMPDRIMQLLNDDGQPQPRSRAEFVRTVLQSLAHAYADAIWDIEQLTGRTITAVHLVGGGAQNALLCQLTADTVGLPVFAGPIEATAIGNLLVQLRTLGTLPGDLETLRAVVARSFPPHRYAPRATARKD